MAQWIIGSHRSCFGTQNRNDNRNDNRNSAGSRGVYCSCLGTRNRNGVGVTVPVWAPKTGTVLGVTVPV